jgi:hypothetical protein
LIFGALDETCLESRVIVVCAKSQLSYLSEKKRLERLNRARNFFGDPVQRRDDRLTFEGKSIIEEYSSGRMALILYSKIFPLELVQRQSPRLVGNQPLLKRPFFSIFVLKANTSNVDDLQEWNKELMFVSNIQVIQSPDRVIPSLVGLYVVQEQIMDFDLDLLLFEKIHEGSFQFISGIANGKPTVFGDFPATLYDNVVPENVECAPEIVQHIPDHHSGILGWKCIGVVKPGQQIPSFQILVDRDDVKIIFSGPSIQFGEVLRGPLNFYP